MKNYLICILIVCIGCSKNKTDIKSNVNSKVEYYNSKYKDLQRVDIVKANFYVDSILIISKKNNYTKGIGIANLNYGLSDQVKGNFDASLMHIHNALSIFSTLNNDTLIAKCYDANGINYWQKGKNDKALQYIFKSLEINEHLNIKNEIAANYNHISMVFQSQDKITIAEDYANKAMKIVEKLQPNISNISVFHNLANIYGMQGKYNEALQLDSIGLDWCNTLKVEYNKSIFYDNMANCNYFQGNLKQAIQLHLKTIAIDSSCNNNKQVGDTYSSLGAIYEENKDYAQAIKYYEKSIELCKQTGYKNGQKIALELLSSLYLKTNDINNAYKYLKESIVIKDSIINTASEQKIAELQTLYETEKKKQEIAQQALKISRKNILLFALVFVIILLFIAFIFFYNKKKNEQERKLQEELIKEEEKRTKAILESEDNERQRLARELHDGVGQLLTATKLNLNTLQQHLNNDNKTLQNSLEILDDSIKEIRNISHNMVPDVLLKYGLTKAIQDFTDRINQTKKINIEFECIGCNENNLDDTSKLMLYRIVQESVNNTLKYANASQLNIQLSTDDTEISLLMEDNGVGFNVEDAIEKNGIGLKNMKLRTDYLKGKLDISSSPKYGTTILIVIPIQKIKDANQ